MINKNREIREDCNCSEKQLSLGKKIKYSFYSALIFFFISAPVMYQLTNKINGHLFNVVDQAGCPSNSGLLLHTAIFFIIIFITMVLA
jgi:hypothetical protein